VNWSLGGDKTVLYIDCIFIIIISIIKIISISISFVILTHKFPLLSVSPPHPTEGKGEG